MFFLKQKLARWKWASRAVFISAGLILLFLWPGPLFIRWGIFLAAALTAPLFQLERKKFRISATVAVITTLALTVLNPAEAPFLKNFLIAAALIAVFFLLEGLANLIFINSRVIYYLLNTVLALIGSIAVFQISGSVWLSGLASFLLFSALLLESLKFININHIKPFVVSGVIGLIMSEITAISIFLPLNILSFSAFLTLCFINLRSLLHDHFTGLFSVKRILEQTIVFLAVAVIIFSATIWNL